MTDEECENLLETLREEFEELGEQELAELADYTIETDEGWVRPDPRKRLLKMLDAFEAVVALEDNMTLEMAMGKIEHATGGDVPRVVVLPARDEARDLSEPLSFEFFDQSDIRERLQVLQDEVAQDEPTRDPGGPAR